jgi:hypothetical protein
MGSAVALLVVAMLAMRTMDIETLVIGIGSIVIGLIPLTLIRNEARTASKR